MARPGTRPAATKTNYQTLPSIPAGQKLNKDEGNYIIDKIVNPHLTDTFSGSIKADDNYNYGNHNQSGAIAFIKDPTFANPGIGHGAEGTITADGASITFTGDFSITKPHKFDSGSVYRYKFKWNGSKFVGYIKLIGTVTDVANLLQPNVWHVNASYAGGDSDGSFKRPFTNPQDAHDAASANDVILINTGTYTSLTISKNISVISYARYNVYGDGASQVEISTVTIGNTFKANLQEIRVSDLRGPGAVVVKDCYINSITTSAFEEAYFHESWINSSSVSYSTTGDVFFWNCQVSSAVTSYRVEGINTAFHSDVTSTTAAITLRNSSVRGNVNAGSNLLLYGGSRIFGTITVSAPGTITWDQPLEKGVWYVSTYGNDKFNGSKEYPFLTVEQAHDAASDGDTIYIGIGTFTETFSVTKNLSLIGKNAQWYGSSSTLKTIISGTITCSDGVDYFHTDSIQITTLTYASSTLGIQSEIKGSYFSTFNINGNGTVIMINSVVTSLVVDNSDVYIWQSTFGTIAHTTGGTTQLSFCSTGGNVSFAASCTFISDHSTIYGFGTIAGDLIWGHGSYLTNPILLNAFSAPSIGATISTCYSFLPIVMTIGVADVRTLNASPVTLFPAGGANNVILVSDIIAKMNYLTSAFAGGTKLQIKDSGGQVRFESSASFIQTTSNRREEINIVSADGIVIADNVDLEATSEAVITGGGGNIVLYYKCKYISAA